MTRPITAQDAQRIIKRMGDLTTKVVLVGGQALNVWAARYIEREPSLAQHGPFTSKDIDFQGDRSAVRICAERLGGRLFIPGLDDHTPNTGKVVFVDENEQREIDFIQAPFGLDADDVLEKAIPFDVLDDKGQPTGYEFLVLHPVHCLESRVCNTVGLPGYDTAHALEQLRASVLIARCFLYDLLEAGEPKAVRKLNERIFHFAISNSLGRKVHARYAIDPFEATVCDARLG